MLQDLTLIKEDIDTPDISPRPRQRNFGPASTTRQLMHTWVLSSPASPHHWQLPQHHGTQA